jgi:cytochrome P450
MDLWKILSTPETLWALLAVLVVPALAFYVVVPLVHRARIASSYRPLSGTDAALIVSPFVPVLGDFLSIGKAKFKPGVRVARDSRSTMENFEHQTVYDLVGGKDHVHNATVLMNMAFYVTIGTTSPDILRDVLVRKSKSFGKPPFIKVALSPVIGEDNLVLLVGEAHSVRKRLLSPAFSIRNIKKLVAAFARASKVHVTRVAAETRAFLCEHKGHAFVKSEILPWVSRLTLDVIGFAAFGGWEAEGTEVSPASRVAKALDGLAEKHNQDINTNPLYVLLPYGWWQSVPTANNQSKTARFRELCSVADSIIAARRSYLEDSSHSKPNDVLQLLIDSEGAIDGSEKVGHRAAVKLTDDQIRDEGLLLLFAGHETTAVLVTWSMFLLSQFPEWYRRAQVEAEGARRAKIVPFQATDEEAETVDPSSALPVINGILKEALRLYPPVAVYSRESLHDIYVGQDDRLFLPKGTTVNIPAGPIHRDPVSWPDPDAFDPCRWMNDDQVAALGLERLTTAQAHEWKARRDAGKGPSPAEEAKAAHPMHVSEVSDMSFLPFASGPTACLGQKFALFEACCILPWIVVELDFALADGYVHAPVTLMTTRPRHGMAMELSPRE